MALNTITLTFNEQGEQVGLKINGKSFKEIDGRPIRRKERRRPALWGKRNSLRLVEGSFCVIIGGRKYCA